MAIQKQIWISDSSATTTRTSVGRPRHNDDATSTTRPSTCRVRRAPRRRDGPRDGAGDDDAAHGHLEKYDMHEFTTDPTLIRDIDEMEVIVRQATRTCFGPQRYDGGSASPTTPRRLRHRREAVPTTGPIGRPAEPHGPANARASECATCAAFTMVNAPRYSMAGATSSSTPTRERTSWPTQAENRDYTEKIDIETGTIGR